MTPVTTSEVLDQFRAALIAREIVPPDSIIADGRLHRCNAAGARGTGDAAYLLHLDGVPAGGMESEWPEPEPLTEPLDRSRGMPRVPRRR